MNFRRFSLSGDSTTFASCSPCAPTPYNVLQTPRNYYFFAVLIIFVGNIYMQVWRVFEYDIQHFSTYWPTVQP